MGKRPAEVELFVGNMGSIQREDAAFYAKRRIANHGNRTRTNSGDYNAVNQLLKSVVRKNCTLRSVGAGAGDRPGHPVAISDGRPYRDQQLGGRPQVYGDAMCLEHLQQSGAVSLNAWVDFG